ncbi:phage portal protein [Rothia koreensis]|uniref:phage portal protein n=1 Tax=Rothia koreensis TaxID=592378 RepID=UPI003FCE9BE0
MFTVDEVRQLRVPELSDEVAQQVKDLLTVYSRHYSANRTRTLYCDSEQAFIDLGIGVPPAIQAAKHVLGWSAQAVKKPAMRTQLEGLRLPGVDDPFGLNAIFDANRFASEFGQAVYSAYKHGVAFISVDSDPEGDCPVQIVGHSAEEAAGVWDKRLRRLRSALTIADVDVDGKPTMFVVYLLDRTITCQQVRGSTWTGRTVMHHLGRVQVVPVLSCPELDAPMGRSRLTKSAMRLNDMAVRTLARMETNAEFYSSPQLALLGVDRETFAGHGLSKNEKFRLAADRLIALSKDADGDRPELTQLRQASMNPHADMLRTLAMAFSGETSIPPSSLGVIHDQPASAEAIRAAEHDLLVDVSNHNNNIFPYAVKEVAALAFLASSAGGLRVPENFWKLSVRFVDPEHGSMFSEADGIQKIASSMSELAKWPVLMERMFTDAEVERVKADAQSAQVGDLISRLGAQTNPQVPAESTAGTDSPEAVNDDSFAGTDRGVPSSAGHRERRRPGGPN